MFFAPILADSIGVINKKAFKQARKEVLQACPLSVKLFAFENIKMAIAVERISGEFYRVGVAYCNQYDKFSRKTGKAIALQRLLHGECVNVKYPIDNVGSPYTTQELCQMVAEEFGAIFS